MPIYEPSLRWMNTLLNPEPRNVLSCSLAALVTGALSQVEVTMELTNRVYDRYVASQTRQNFGSHSVLGSQDEARFPVDQECGAKG
jgi:hypothetical protein